jgi:Tol biopolymer transport system component
LAIGVTAFAVLAAMSGGWELWRSRTNSAFGPIKVVPLITNSGVEGRPAFSPDGAQVAFMWNGGEGSQYDIYVKLIGDGSPPVRLTRSPGTFAGWPVWSPDGHRIGFVRCSDPSNGAIFVVPSVGGTDRKITEVRYCPIVDWSPDGKVLAFQDTDSDQEFTSIFIVSPDTGKRRRLTMPPKLEGDGEPKFSPDGKTLAFVRTRNLIIADIFIVPVDGGEPKQLTFMGHRAFLGGDFSGLAWTADGKEIVFSAGGLEAGNNSLWRVKVSGGTPEKVRDLAGVNATEPAISRQGHRLAYRTVTVNTSIWQIRFQASGGRRAAPVRLISSTRSQDGPQYSPDGRRIVFGSDRSGSAQIWMCDSDGSNPTQLTFMDASNVGTPRWSADGRSILFDSTAAGNNGIYRISVDGGNAQPVVVDSHFNGTPSASRDGRWIYFGSDRSGEFEVWKVPSNGGQPVQVTSHSGWYPMESMDGRLLYYVKTNLPVDPSSARATLWAMPVAGAEEYLVTSQLIHSHWTVVPNGIYLTDPDTKPHTTLKFLDTRTRQISTIATLEGELSENGQSLAVSPDGRSVLYSLHSSLTTDLMLVENFR